MIVKNFELKDKIINKNNFFLFYGENQGFKEEITKKICDQKKLKALLYYEKEVLNNLEDFFSSITTKSFFDSKKIIIIKDATDKIKDLVEEIIDKKIEDTIIILNSGILDKRSKLRNFFEKDNRILCTPFYPDEHKDLNKIASEFFKHKKIKISQQTLNLIIERANHSRHHLRNELEKIDNFSLSNKKINDIDIIKLTNLGKNYEISELVETCLLKNENKLKKIMNENHFSDEETIIILRTFLTKTKRLLNLSINYKLSKNYDEVISKYKPPIFWKEKANVKQQLNHWSEQKLKKIINDINEIEILIKKNTQISQCVISNFIFENSK